MPGVYLSFQCQYVSLRLQQLSSYIGLVKACISFQTSPPPAIATSQAQSTGADKHRFQHVIKQVREGRGVGNLE